MCGNVTLLDTCFTQQQLTDPCHSCAQSAPELTTLDDKPALAMTISEQTPAVKQATGTGSSPALTSLAEVRA